MHLWEPALPAMVTALFKRRCQFQGASDSIALEPEKRLDSAFLFAGRAGSHDRYDLRSGNRSVIRQHPTARQSWKPFPCTSL